MNIGKGIKIGAAWGLGLAVVATIPQLFMPIGEPRRGADLIAMAKADWHRGDFWAERMFSFLVLFVVGFVIAGLIGAFSPERKMK
ncbi:MAG: hypothetical protein WCL49_08785 [bacterium]